MAYVVETVGVIDRALPWLLPLVLLGLVANLARVLSLCGEEAWSSFVQILVLLPVYSVVLLRRRLSPNVRFLAYSIGTLVFGFAGFCAGILISALLVMLLYNTLAFSGMDAFAGLPLALIALVLLIVISSIFLGGSFGYRLGARH